MVDLSRFFDKEEENVLGKGVRQKTGKDEIGITKEGVIHFKTGIQKRIYRESGGKREFVINDLRRKNTILGLFLEIKTNSNSNKGYKELHFARGGSGNAKRKRGLSQVGMKTDLRHPNVNVLPFAEQDCELCERGTPILDEAGEPLPKELGVPTEIIYPYGKLDDGAVQIKKRIEIDGVDANIVGVEVFIELYKGIARKNKNPYERKKK